MTTAIYIEEYPTIGATVPSSHYKRRSSQSWWYILYIGTNDPRGEETLKEYLIKYTRFTRKLFCETEHELYYYVYNKANYLEFHWTSSMLRFKLIIDTDHILL